MRPLPIFEILVMDLVFDNKSLKIYCYTVNAFQENTYILVSGNEAAVVDPGFFSTEEKTKFENWVTTKGVRITYCWLTHSHIDHVLGLDWLTRSYGIGFLQSEIDNEDLRSVPLYAHMYGVPSFQIPATKPSLVKEGNVLNFGQNEAKVLFLPGHSRGHIGFYFEELGVLLSGDVLFRESIGRTDLPGGDFSILSHSITTKLYTLPEATVVIPGHMEPTTIGFEKKHNPFVRN